MFWGSPYYSPAYFLSPYWDTGEFVPSVIEPPLTDGGGGGGGYGPPGRIYGIDDGERKSFVLKARVDDDEIVEILSMIVQSGVLDQ